MRVSLSLSAAAAFTAMMNVAAQQTNVTAGDDAACVGINCHTGSFCVDGDADFSDHPVDINGVAFDFLQQTNKDGVHCECPDNWTGLRCNRKFVRCPGTDHVCYHGGKCLDGIEDMWASDQLFCDCSDAVHQDIPYVGKFCEIAGAVECGDTDIFCTNRGTCAEGFESKTYPCDCPQGHRGPHCEFDTGFVPDCDLECDNGGTCMLGMKDYDTALHAEFWALHDGKYMYCDCPEGWFGPKCEIQGEKCGNDTCFNGAHCLQTEHSDGEVDYTCDCSTASNKEKSFAGEFCENEASTFCTKNGNQNGQLFCVNGGTCKEEEHEGCECPAGFHGPICEFRDGQVVDECKLQCQNGGLCRAGKKDNKLFQQFGNELSRYNETHRLWEHCVCPEGYFGIQCEHQLEICPGGEHVCLHGSKCVPEAETTNETTHSCDCDDAFDANEQYAGKFCQYTSTDICTKSGKPGVGKANFAFCVNSGKCKARVSDNEDHPGCDCTDGFKGPHCEFLETTLVAEPTQEGGSTNQNGGLVIGLAACLLLLVALLGGAVMKKYFADEREDAKTTSGADDTKIAEDETVDMQSPHSPTSSISPKDLQTVEII